MNDETISETINLFQEWEQTDKEVGFGVYCYNKALAEVEKKVDRVEDGLKRERKRIDEDKGTPDFETLRDIEIAFGEGLIKHVKQELQKMKEKNGTTR